MLPRVAGFALGLALSALLAHAEAEGQAADQPPQAAASADTQAENPNRIQRENLVVEFSVRPAMRESGAVMAADWADVSFRITDANSGAPVGGRYPAAWMDLAQVWASRGDAPMSCRERVSTYLKGIIGVRPMIDLNSHYLLVMNRDASISVIDPAVGMTGITNLFAQVVLERPPADWAKTRDEKRLFVTMPRAKKVALVDTEVFKVTAQADAGEAPTRAVLQADQRYLWVGNNARQAQASGVTIIDTSTLKPVKFIATGRGHHEIALSDNDRYAFVSNREEGTVSVIEVKRLKKLKDVQTGPLPISLAYSAHSKLLYVADGKAGDVAVVDPARRKILTRIALKPGLGPLRFTPDGRWGLVVNPSEDAVFVLDAATNQRVHTVPVAGKPYQLSFTRQYAYVRSLASEHVGMIPRASLGGSKSPPVTYFPAGDLPPGRAPDLGIANGIVPAVKEAAVFVVNQAQGTVYYYMEGMNSPAGGFRNYGHEARAVEIADRSLREKEPGLYSGRVKIPRAGTYDIAFIMDAPRFLHCFSAKVEPNPSVREVTGPMSVRFIIANRSVPVGQSVPVRFQLGDPKDGSPLKDLRDVQVLYYDSSGGGRTVVPARVVGEGEYEADVLVSTASTHYVFVASASQNARFSDLPYATLIGTAPAPQQDNRASAPVEKAPAGEQTP